MIDADGVAVRLGRRTVLSGIDLAVRPGTITGIVGPNGGGKSTLLRALIGAVPLSAGRVAIDGVELGALGRREIARRAAFVGQHASDDSSLRVADEVALGGLPNGRGGRAFDGAVAGALDAVGMAGAATEALRTLSGGERQRVAIARALVQGADYALLDEPTNHLDIRHRLQLAAMLREIAPTVIIVLHDLDLAARICDHVVLLHEGALAAAGTPAQVLTPAVLDEVYRVDTLALTAPDDVPVLSFRLPRTESESP